MDDGGSDVERSEERAAVREAAATVREEAAAEVARASEQRSIDREAASDERTAELTSVLPGIHQALNGLNQTMQSLIERLHVVGKSNEDLRRWRKRATVSGVLAAVAMLIAVFATAKVSETARQDNCANVAAAFDAYTTALEAAVGDVDPAVVTAFRSAYEPQLDDCF